jgi:hypothetical protein
MRRLARVAAVIGRRDAAGADSIACRANIVIPLLVA